VNIGKKSLLPLFENVVIHI